MIVHSVIIRAENAEINIHVDRASGNLEIFTVNGNGHAVWSLRAFAYSSFVRGLLKFDTDRDFNVLILGNPVAGTSLTMGPHADYSGRLVCGVVTNTRPMDPEEFAQDIRWNFNGRIDVSFCS